jgi:RNA polymerase sigma-B factor
VTGTDEAARRFALSARRPGSGRLANANTNELFVLWQQGRDPRARDELVSRFLPLARKLARRYVGREPFDDLLQVASYGLLKAIERFDSGRGTAFSSFAVPTILGELKRHFRDTGWFVHVPRGVQELALKVEEAEQHLGAKSGRAVTTQDLAEFLEVSNEDVVEALDAAAGHHSTPLDGDGGDADGDGASLIDVLGKDDERFELIEAAVTIASAAGELSEAERTVLRLYFLEDRTQTQIAERIGVSQMQVSRILRRAVQRLRHLTEDAPTTGLAGNAPAER